MSGLIFSLIFESRSPNFLKKFILILTSFLVSLSTFFSMTLTRKPASRSLMRRLLFRNTLRSSSETGLFQRVLATRYPSMQRWSLLKKVAHQICMSSVFFLRMRQSSLADHYGFDAYSMNVKQCLVKSPPSFIGLNFARRLVYPSVVLFLNVVFVRLPLLLPVVASAFIQISNALLGYFILFWVHLVVIIFPSVFHQSNYEHHFHDEIDQKDASQPEEIYIVEFNVGIASIEEQSEESYDDCLAEGEEDSLRDFETIVTFPSDDGCVKHEWPPDKVICEGIVVETDDNQCRYEEASCIVEELEPLDPNIAGFLLDAGVADELRDGEYDTDGQDYCRGDYGCHRGGVADGCVEVGAGVVNKWEVGPFEHSFKERVDRLVTNIWFLAFLHTDNDQQQKQQSHETHCKGQLETSCTDYVSSGAEIEKIEAETDPAVVQFLGECVCG